MKQQKAYVEGRDAKQIASIASAYFTYDAPLLFASSSLFLSLAPGELWFKIAIPIAFAIPPIIRTISTYDVPKKRSITVDKLQVDDPSGFFIELDRLRK